MGKITKEKLDKMDCIEIYKMVLKGDVLKTFPKSFWQKEEAKENAAKCTRYLFEDVLKYDDEVLKKKISTSLFAKNKLLGMLTICFNNSCYQAINNAYPNRFKEWEFKNVPRGYWNDKDNGIRATRWLIEEKLKLDDKELKKHLSINLFTYSCLDGMLNSCFNGSPYEAINSAYPNKFKEWEFKNVPIRYWNRKENVVNAIKWLIEEKLKLSDEELKESLGQSLFKSNGLISMLRHCFNGSPYQAINSVYPNKFKEWEFQKVPHGYWDKEENGIKATKWLVEEKLKLDNNKLKEKLSKKIFIDNGLSGMLSNCFDGSPYQAINKAYPGKFKEWEFKNVPRGYWNRKENGIKATKWLIEEKLILSSEELKEQLSIQLFKENGLISMVQICFNGSPYDAINCAYPNKFKKSDFKGYK